MTKYIILLITIIGLSSCYNDRIELDLNDGNEKLVILAWITDLNEPQYVSITKTINYLGQDDPEFISDAIVILQDEIQNYELEYDSRGRYYVPDDFQPRVGDVYQLEVTHDGIIYSAQQMMRPCPDIEQLKLNLDNETAGGPDSIDHYHPTFAFQESPGKGDAYFTVDYAKGSPFSKYIPFGLFTDDEYLDGEYLENVWAEVHFYSAGDTVIVDLHSINPETSDFLSDIETEIFRDTPFDPPPANIPSNIDGGAVGYFIVSSAKREVIIVE